MIVKGAGQGVVAATCVGCEFAPEVASMLDEIACDANQNQAPGVGVDMMEQFFVRRPNIQVLDQLTKEMNNAVAKNVCDPSIKRCAAVDFLINKA